MREACWYEEIYVVQKPTKKGKCDEVTLYIDYKGKTRIEGKQIPYKQNSIELEDKIEEAYRYAYKRFILGH
jgi:hypothetical protein